jgi:hypothetical protein
MFGRLVSHLGMSFHDLGLTTLFLKNYIDLKVQENLKMLYLFGLKITFPMQIKLNYLKFLFILLFDLMCKYKKFCDKKPNLINMGGTHYIDIVGLPFN